jgi:hypothetical protein
MTKLNMLHNKKKTYSKNWEWKENHLNITKVTYGKPTANIILNGKILKVFHLRSETKQRCPLPSLLFSMVQELIAATTGK